MLRFLRKRRIRRISSDVPDGETIVLHISDTPETVYPFIEELIDELSPDYIIHTGDLVDNVKLERRPDLKPAYMAGLRKIARILKGSGSKLYVVPGNEDDVDALRTFFEGSTLEPGSIIDINGVKLALGHRSTDVAELNADFRLYGHNFIAVPRGLNGVKHANLLLIPSRRVVKINYPVGTDTSRGYKLRRGL